MENHNNSTPKSQTNIAFKDIKFSECPSCLGSFFTQTFRIGTINKSHPQNSTGQDQIIRIEILNTTRCVICKERFELPIKDDSNPLEIQETGQRELI